MGNQNARKHGFYSKVLDKTERRNLELATEVEGIDEEIELLRVKIKSLAERDPDNIKLIMKATGTLSRLLRTRQKIGMNDKGKQLKEAVDNAFKNMILPLEMDRQRHDADIKKKAEFPTPPPDSSSSLCSESE